MRKFFGYKKRQISAPEKMDSLAFVFFYNYLILLWLSVRCK